MLVYLKPHFELKTLKSFNIKSEEGPREIIKKSNKKKIIKISKTTCLSIVDDNKTFNFNIRREDCKKLLNHSRTNSKLSKFYKNISTIDNCKDQESSEEIFRKQKCNDKLSNQKIIEPILGIDILSAYGEIT
jgi:hypothetical protein